MQKAIAEELTGISALGRKLPLQAPQRGQDARSALLRASKTSASKQKAWGPETRTTARAEAPAAVDSAAMVSPAPRNAALASLTFAPSLRRPYSTGQNFLMTRCSKMPKTLLDNQ